MITKPDFPSIMQVPDGNTPKEVLMRGIAGITIRDRR